MNNLEIYNRPYAKQEFLLVIFYGTERGKSHCDRLALKQKRPPFRGAPFFLALEKIYNELPMLSPG